LFAIYLLHGFFTLFAVACAGLGLQAPGMYAPRGLTDVNNTQEAKKRMRKARK